VSRFGPDAVRYYFLKETEFGKDGDFSEGRFIDIINAHLANTIGKSRMIAHHAYGEFETLGTMALLFCLSVRVSSWTANLKNLKACVGNLLNRTLGLLKKNCDAIIPSDSISIPEDNSIRVLATESVSIGNLCIEQLGYARFHTHPFLSCLHI
jgi:methionyl-tRNA synthetase